MSAQLKEIYDGRDPLQKYSRKELEYLARKEGRLDIEPGMPADLMRKRFRVKPPGQFPPPIRNILGGQKRLVVPPFQEWLELTSRPTHSAPDEPEVIEVNADDLLEQEYANQKAFLQPSDVPEPKAADESPYAKIPFWELKKEVAKRGIKVNRTWKKTELLRILDGEDPAELRK